MLSMFSRRLSRQSLPLCLGLMSMAMAGCGTGLPTEPGEDGRTLLVWGYVMADGLPARGGAALFDPAGVVVAATPVETGRYLIGLELPTGTQVCDGYRIRVVAAIGRSSELEERVLEAESGDCIVPPDAKARHTIDFSFSGDSTSTPGGTL